ncbi:quinone oxidoreductase [uncultured Jatrophihabitans sp.]|uniref:quinone oxidoreductase family protein n=1 Tax=uncultured Jatrophihabitans sp. TaxID=1610747 RepID=UPI0035CAEAA1
MADNMRAAVVTRFGGPEVVEVRDVPRPRPGPGEVLLEVLASGVNFADVYRREGRRPGQPPFTLGTECAGRVVEVGAGVGDVALGDLVVTARSASGTHAQYAVLAADAVVPVPAGVSAELAAAAILQGMTAHYLAASTFPLQPGHVALVHAAAGGVGQLLSQLAVARGARVIGVVGAAGKAQPAHHAGAVDVLVQDEVDDLAAAVRELAPGGVDVVYDGIGQATFEASLAALRPRGTLALYGMASGPVPPFDLQRLNSGSLYVTRPALGDYIADRDELLWRAGDVLGGVADGSLRVSVGGRYALDDVGRAYAELESRRSTGKLLIVP